MHGIFFPTIKETALSWIFIAASYRVETGHIHGLYSLVIFPMGLIFCAPFNKFSSRPIKDCLIHVHLSIDGAYMIMHG